MASYLFVSYSRAQLAFAESLALTAVEYGLLIWFDLLALMPGGTWRADVRAGLQNAGGVVLLVSQESLASQPVAEEVQCAIAAQKPLFLLLTEAVDLSLRYAPGIDLAAQAHSIVDMRGDFRRGFERLITAFRTGAPCRDPLRSPNLLRLPTRIPRDVAAVAAALAIPAAGLVAVAAGWLSGGLRWDRLRLTDPLASMTATNLAMLGGCALWQFWIVIRLLRRRLSIDLMLQGLTWCDLFLVYAIQWQRLHLLANPLLAPRAPVSGWYGYALLLAALAASGFAFYACFHSPDLFRWMPAGFAGSFQPVRRRQVERVNCLVAEMQARAGRKTDGRPYSYVLHSSPADEPIARLVRAAMKHNRVSARELSAPRDPSSSGGSEAAPLRVDLDFLLVTNRLAESSLRKVLASHQGYLIALLAAPVRLPPDLENLLSELQWVEFRDLAAYQIGFLLMSLRGMQPAKTAYAANYLPARLDALKGPVAIPQMALLLRLLGCLSAACGAFALVSPAGATAAAARLPWALPLGIWQFAMVHWLYRRSLTFPWFALQLVASLLLAVLVGVPKLIVDAGRQRFVGAGVNGLFDGWSLLINGLLLLLVLAFGLWQLGTKWLPVAAAPPDGPALRGPSHLAIARGHVIFIVLALMLFTWLAVNPVR